jgi:polyisoprenoid-binding protein YceI
MGRPWFASSRKVNRYRAALGRVESIFSGTASLQSMAKQNWNFDPVHSNLSFSVRHLMITKVTGHFNKWSGTLELDPDDLTASQMEVKIEAASIDTKDAERDKHLRSGDFFDVERFPEITFKSTHIEKVNDENFRVTGDFTIRDVTKPVVLDVEYYGRQKDPWGIERAGFAAKTSIDRKDYGLVFNMPLEGGGVLVGDTISITIDVEAVKDAGAKAA